MSKEEAIEVTATVLETLPNAMFKIAVDDNQHEVFKWLSDDSYNGWCHQQPTWNFCKYIINEQGNLTHFFSQNISPLSNQFIEAIVK